MGGAKRARPVVDENVLFLNTFEVHLASKLTEADYAIASELLKEAFPGAESDLKIEGNKQLFYLRELLKCRHAVAILGKQGLAGELNAESETVTLVSNDQAYGVLKESGEFEDGEFTKAFRKLAA